MPAAAGLTPSTHATANRVALEPLHNRAVIRFAAKDSVAAGRIVELALEGLCPIHSGRLQDVAAALEIAASEQA